MRDYLAPIDSEARDDVAKLAAFVIEHAQTFGLERWGTTPYPEAIRVNVGWTEILTANPGFLRLIVDGELAVSKKLPAAVQLVEGPDHRGYYPSVPGSLLAEIEYRPVGQFRRALSILKPALRESVRIAARRRVGSGVRAGHRQQVVVSLANRLGVNLPDPGLSAAVDLSVGAALMEGALERVVGSKYERNAAARRACIEHHGVSCLACGFSFEAVYGILGAQFIHVHHIRPVSTLAREYIVDPVRDLVPVCPNCHAMLHRDEPPLALDQLRDLILRPPEA